MWDLWFTKWHWDRVFSQFFGFALSVSFHRCSILIYHHPMSCDTPDQAAHFRTLSPKLGASSLTRHLAGAKERSISPHGVTQKNNIDIYTVVRTSSFMVVNGLNIHEPLVFFI
jgi:hypothetical protein